MRRVNDPRMSHGCPIYRDRHGYFISAKFMTPFLFNLSESAIFEPLIDVWKTLMWLLAIDVILTFFGHWSAFLYTDTSRSFVYSVMGGAWLLWKLNVISQYRLTRLFLGKRLRVRMTFDGELWIGRRKQNLDHSVAFGTRALDDAEDWVYQRSQYVSLIVGDLREHRLATIFGRREADAFVRNANLLLTMGNGPRGGELDVDPMGRG